MSTSEQKLSERYYAFHRRAMGLTLLMVAAITTSFLVRILGPADQAPLAGLGRATIIFIAYIVALAAVRRATLGRAWQWREPELQAIARDEWTQLNMSRARQAAFWTVMGAQFPMMFVMADVPPEPSVAGMGQLTMMVGFAAYFGFYLYFTRQRSDG